MSLKLVEVVVLGQVLRLNVPAEQEEILRQAARNLDLQVSEMKERTGLLQLDRVLSIVALNLSFELTQEKNKMPRLKTFMYANSAVRSFFRECIRWPFHCGLIKKNRMLKVRFFLCVFNLACNRVYQFQFFVALFLHAIYCCLVKNKHSHNILADKNVHAY